MKNLSVLLLSGLMISPITIPANAQNGEAPFSHARLSSSKSESALFDLIERTSMDTSKTWKDLDKIYREQVVISGSRDLKSNTYLFMVSRKFFIEEGDVQSLQYYAKELEGIEFNINLHTIVALIHKLSSVWGEDETARYAKSMHEKNLKFWNEHFSGKTSYLTKNEDALQELKSLSLSN